MKSDASFDHLDAGTPEEQWADRPEWANAADAEALVRAAAAILVISAHPDDETLGVGGLAAQAADLGLPVHFLLATDGEASHPRSPTHRPADLARLRVSEYDAAVDHLVSGAGRTRLGLPDGDLNRNGQALAEGIEAALRSLSADAQSEGDSDVLLVAPWQGDRHPDHAAAGAAAAAVAARHRNLTAWEYPIWLWHWGRPPEVPWAHLAVLRLTAAAAARKAEALRMHRSQIEPLSDQPGDEVLIAAPVLAHFRRPFDVLIAAGH